MNSQGLKIQAPGGSQAGRQRTPSGGPRGRATSAGGREAPCQNRAATGPGPSAAIWEPNSCCPLPPSPSNRHRWRAAREGGSEPFIRRLEHGYQTRLGKEFGGTQLSGGEWQKLALSRAFMREADLLILDEPTASLDVRTEAEI